MAQQDRNNNDAASWQLPFAPEPHYSAGELETIERLEHDLEKRMSKVKPRRFAHSLSVARTAERMAQLYGVDAYQARVAGILHDWDKVVPDEELVGRARKMQLDLGVDLDLVRPLLHGIVAARELPELYPDLPSEVFQAIERHTTGSVDMTPLDEVVFVADGIEPLRKSYKGLNELRDGVGILPLDELYWKSFTGGIIYVVKTERYLYPGTLDIYNTLALRREQERQ